MDELHRAAAESVLSVIQRQNCVALQQPVPQRLSSTAVQQSLCSVHYTASELRRAAAACAAVYEQHRTTAESVLSALYSVRTASRCSRVCCRPATSELRHTTTESEHYRSIYSAPRYLMIFHEMKA